MILRTIIIFGLLATAMAPFAQAQAIQLPTIHVTGVSTTVMVPDRGSTVLGGVSRSSSGSVSRGVPGLSHVPGANRLFGNRAIGNSTSTATMSVSAHIHDLPAMDEALLAEAAARRGPLSAESGATRMTSTRTLGADDGKAAFLTRHLETRTPEPTPVETKSRAKTHSLEEIRKQNMLALERQNAEARSFIAQGQQAEQDGKQGAAKVFYNMAVRRATGDLQAYARILFANLGSNAKKSNAIALGQ